MKNHSIILKTDSYKISHWPQYQKGTTRVGSYFESRGGRYKDTVFYGLQGILDNHLVGQVVTMEAIDYAEAVCIAHFGNDKLFNRAGWEHIVRDHDGKLPLLIKAPMEGSVIPVSNALMTVENTCDQCYWLTNYVETLLVQAWYPITVATQSREIKKVILKWLNQNGDPSLIDYKLHDFGFRGVSSTESAAIGGAAHLVNFRGTDTLPALLYANDFYAAGLSAANSIPAAEHSTITSWGLEREREAYANMLDQYPDGLVAVVSDSYDINNAVKNLWGRDLRDRVLARKGTLVVRPDSGNPRDTVLEVVKGLDAAFGHHVNYKGYKVLDSHVRVIQGDGVDINSIDEILLALSYAGYSADNVAFGMGGALLQKLDRDTQKFAFKCSWTVVNGEFRDVFKKPIGDLSKASKAGQLALIKDATNGYRTVTIPRNGINDALNDMNQLVTKFLNGQSVSRQHFDDVRLRAVC